jgi:hypothetical protein
MLFTSEFFFLAMMASNNTVHPAARSTRNPSSPLGYPSREDGLFLLFAGYLIQAIRGLYRRGG